MGSRFNTDVGKLDFGIDALFGAAEENEEGITEIPLIELHEFRGHPFHVEDDADMMELAASIREHGVMVPAIARKHPEGGYELISGHRRWRASVLAGKNAMPVLVRELNDREAIDVMVDSNLNRPTVLPSEKAFAYKMKMDAWSHQGREGGNTAAGIGGESGDSARTVYRYIRLTGLIKPLLKLVDKGKIKIQPGWELADLCREDQETLYHWIEENRRYPGQKQSEAIRKRAKEGEPFPLMSSMRYLLHVRGKALEIRPYSQKASSVSSLPVPNPPRLRNIWYGC